MISSNRPIARICTTTLKVRKPLLASRFARPGFTAETTIRTMATSSSEKREFLIILPDKPGTTEKRLEVRPQHLKAVLPHVENAKVLLGGALLEEHTPEGVPLKFHGSAMLITASSAEEAKDFLKKDIYTTSGVWDWDKAQVFPFKTAVGRGV